MANEYVDEGIPFLRSQNIQPFYLELTEVKYITPRFHRKLQKSALLPGDVVLVRTGYPGTACVIPPNLPVSNCADLVIVRPSGELDGRFLAALFNSTWGRGHVAGSLVGVAQQHFNVGAAKEMEIRLPTLTIQRRVGDILSAYDDLIENNTRRIAILEEMARAIYREWFVDYRFPGHEQAEMVESELGLVPAGWEVRRLSDVAQINARSIRKGAEPVEILYVDISSASTGAIGEPTLMTFSDAPGRARRIVQHGDVVWSTVRPNRRVYGLIIDPPPHLIVSTGFAVITCTELPFSFLYHALITEDFAEYLTLHAKGSAYPAVSASDFENARILVPAASVMDLFHGNTAPMLELQHRLRQKNEALRRTRDLLLPKLISGEIDVSAMEGVLAGAAAQ
jgi:type I restriction enzyme S subunit